MENIKRRSGKMAFCGQLPQRRLVDDVSSCQIYKVSALLDFPEHGLIEQPLRFSRQRGYEKEKIGLRQSKRKLLYGERFVGLRQGLVVTQIGRASCRARVCQYV